MRKKQQKRQKKLRFREGCENLSVCVQSVIFVGSFKLVGADSYL